MAYNVNVYVHFVSYLTKKQSLKFEGEIQGVQLEGKLFPCPTKIAPNLNTKTCAFAAQQ